MTRIQIASVDCAGRNYRRQKNPWCALVGGRPCASVLNRLDANSLYASLVQAIWCCHLPNVRQLRLMSNHCWGRCTRYAEQTYPTPDIGLTDLIHAQIA